MKRLKLQIEETQKRPQEGRKRVDDLRLVDPVLGPGSVVRSRYNVQAGIKEITVVSRTLYVRL